MPTIKYDPNGDTPRVIEDKVRALPANQGLNEGDMWKLIDKEVEEARSNGNLREVDAYHSAATRDVHGEV